MTDIIERLRYAVTSDYRLMREAARESADEIERLRVERAELLATVKRRLSDRLNDHLCEMKEGYDDSIVGFNEAWDVMRKLFDDMKAEEAAKAKVERRE